MSGLETERRHLAQARQDIAEGEARIRHQVALLDRLRASGQDTACGEALLKTFRETLQSWTAHRDLILGAIARLEGEGSS